MLVETVNFECGTGLKPEVSALKYGVYDEDKRLHGRLSWHKPWGEQVFPCMCSDEFKVDHF